MVVQQPQVQPQVQQVQPQVQQQTAVPTAQASQIVGSGVQVRAFGAEGFCWQVHVHLRMELDFRRSIVRVMVGSGVRSVKHGLLYPGTLRDQDSPWSQSLGALGWPALLGHICVSQLRSACVVPTSPLNSFIIPLPFSENTSGEESIAVSSLPQL